MLSIVLPARSSSNYELYLVWRGGMFFWIRDQRVRLPCLLPLHSGVIGGWVVLRGRDNARKVWNKCRRSGEERATCRLQRKASPNVWYQTDTLATVWSAISGLAIGILYISLHNTSAKICYECFMKGNV